MAMTERRCNCCGIDIRREWGVDINCPQCPIGVMVEAPRQFQRPAPSTVEDRKAHKGRRRKELASMRQYRSRPMLMEPDLSGLPIYLKNTLWLAPENGRGRTMWVQGVLKYVQAECTIIHNPETGTVTTKWSAPPVQPDPSGLGKMGAGTARVLPDGYGCGPVPWDRSEWIPFKEGEPVFLNRNPRAHTENVGWCSICHEVARTSSEVVHHWRCFVPHLRSKYYRHKLMRGCKLPAVLDGPNVLMKSIKVHVDDRGREYLLGAAFNGTDAVTISEQTPERFTWGKLRVSRHQPKVTVGHVDFWSPELPVAWITAKSQPHERRYAAQQENRYVQVNAAAQWNDHANAGSINTQPREAERWWQEHYPNVTFYPDHESSRKETRAIKSWAKDVMSTALEPVAPPPDLLPVHRDGVLKHDLTPFRGNRGAKQIIHKQTADNAERRVEQDRIRKEAAREAARKMLDDGLIG